MSTSIAPWSRRASAEIRSPSARSRTSPGTSSRASTTARVAVTADGGLLRQVAGQRLDRSLGLALLGEREDGVEDDDGDDRAAERRHPGDEGERGGEPEEKRERVDELLRELARPPSAAPSPQLVRPVCHEPPLGLPAREPLRAASAGRAAAG